MKNLYSPFRGINNVSFGLKREKIREVLGSNYKEIKRNDFAENTSDYYESLGVFIEYSTGNLCDAIEFTNDSNLYFNEEDLLSMKYSEVRNKYDSKSSNKEEEEDIGVTYHDLGFGITAGYNSDNIETIIIFSEDYW